MRFSALFIVPVRHLLLLLLGIIAFGLDAGQAAGRQVKVGIYDNQPMVFLDERTTGRAAR